MIGGASAAVVLLVIVGAACVVNREKTSSEPSRSSTSNAAAAAADSSIHSVSKTVKMLCSPTDYKETCEKALSKAAANSTSSPKDLIKAAVAAIADEVDKSFGRVADSVKSDDPRVRAAVDDCKELFGYAKAELLRTMNGIDAHRLDDLPKKGHELRIWLSSVITDQETCVEGFPEGELKKKMKDGMEAAKHLTSNALAIIGKASSFLSSLHVPGVSGGRRRLLEAEEGRELRGDGFPAWLSSKERRALKGQAKNNLTPNLVVAKDGTGNFTTINDAINAQVIVPKQMVNLTLFGDGSRKTIITGSRNVADGNNMTTYKSATVAVHGDGFVGTGIGFRNTAGAIKHQAVALRVQSDRSVFLNCRMEGYQDTLYAHSMRQFYRNCIISGTVDFIFGDAAAVLQNCILVVRRPLDNQQNIVTAQGRSDGHQPTGFVVHHCRIIPDGRLVPDKLAIRSYLGRPWREYSHTIIMESQIGDFISRDGYLPWDGDFGLKTLSYAEYNNKGAGADTAARVRWPGYRTITSRDDAARYTVAAFLNGDQWIRSTGTPVRLGLYQ
ncbi:putative pectinesterase/pectinesterase inhibitor 45 [Ananas comosus]|uniref:Pectinesterase n=1 Tax=Ananas comosus TaxID=4615 RepID=A0A199W4V8_ANACO|nr:putative pectinesterase/pectinesterase inhibitor 45 [Ananas comosus]